MCVGIFESGGSNDGRGKGLARGQVLYGTKNKHRMVQGWSGAFLSSYSLLFSCPRDDLGKGMMMISRFQLLFSCQGFYNKQEFDLAVDCFTEAVKIDPKNVRTAASFFLFMSLKNSNACDLSPCSFLV